MPAPHLLLLVVRMTLMFCETTHKVRSNALSATQVTSTFALCSVEAGVELFRHHPSRTPQAFRLSIVTVARDLENSAGRIDAAGPSNTSATAQLIVDHHTVAHSDALAYLPLLKSSVEGGSRPRSAEEHARILHNAPNGEGAQFARNTPKSSPLPHLSFGLLTASVLQLPQR
jgi:hypothetical protein